MDVSTKLQLNRALQSEAKLLLATMTPGERAALIEQRPGGPPRSIRGEAADRLVQLGLAVRTPTGVDLTMLGRVAARVAHEARGDAAGIGVGRA